MPDLVPARVYFSAMLGDGDYDRGVAILDAKLDEARQAWSKRESWKLVAGLVVVLALACLAIGIIKLITGAGPISLISLLCVLPLLYFSIAQFVSVECYARFGRAPHALANLMPRFVDQWLAARYEIVGIDSGTMFDRLRTRALVAKVGSVELDPRLFTDKFWPLLFSTDARERSRAAWREYGYSGEEILLQVSQSDHSVAPVSLASAPVAQHIVQMIPAGMKAAWIADAVKRKGYAQGTHRQALLVAVLDALWDELRSPDWQNRKVNNAEVARRCHLQVVGSGQGFHSTELTEGKPSLEPADWIQKVIAGRANGYRFAVEAAEPLVLARASSE